MDVYRRTRNAKETSKITGFSPKTIRTWIATWGENWDGDTTAPKIGPKLDTEEYQFQYMNKSGEELFDVDEFKGNWIGWII